MRPLTPPLNCFPSDFRQVDVWPHFAAPQFATGEVNNNESSKQYNVAFQLSTEYCVMCHVPAERGFNVAGMRRMATVAQWKEFCLVT